MSDHLQGYHGTLSEYLSREARYNLVLITLDQMREKELVIGFSATRRLADQLYVSQRTVQRWAQGGIQSCNVNAEAIINVSLGLVPEKAATILMQDLNRHREEILFNLPPSLATKYAINPEGSKNNKLCLGPPEEPQDIEALELEAVD